jgi:hypothetical protein
MPTLETNLSLRGTLSSHALSSPEHRLSALTTEHDDLDAAIMALLSDSMFDDMLISRLKKRKLQIRDEIAAILCMAGPAREAKAS